MSQKLDIFTATMIAEGAMEADYDTLILAWQMMVDTGLAWSLQGSFGRAASLLIEDGTLKAPAGWKGAR
jgi:hypothetical protein